LLQLEEEDSKPPGPFKNLVFWNWKRYEPNSRIAMYQFAENLK
jgi:hypothetical protein